MRQQKRSPKSNKAVSMHHSPILIARPRPEVWHLQSSVPAACLRATSRPFSKVHFRVRTMSTQLAAVGIGATQVGPIRTEDSRLADSSWRFRAYKHSHCWDTLCIPMDAKTPLASATHCQSTSRKPSSVCLCAATRKRSCSTTPVQRQHQIRVK